MDNAKILEVEVFRRMVASICKYIGMNSRTIVYCLRLEGLTWNNEMHHIIHTSCNLFMEAGKESFHLRVVKAGIALLCSRDN